MSLEEAKKKAALEAVKFVKDNQVLGLGTGSTVYYVIEELGRRVKEEKLKILCIPTSKQSEALAVNLGIPLTTLDEHPQSDLAIDGADQVDPKLDLIKGMGGALTREKIVDNATKFLAIVVDETKLTDKLGVRQPIPIEVIPFALRTATNRIKELGGNPVIRLPKNQPTPAGTYYITDNGNYILDTDFGEVKDPTRLERELKMIPGVLENGLFVNMTHRVYVGSKTGVKIINKNEKPQRE